MSTIIDHNSCVPMYKQVLTVLNEKIARGEFRPGDKLPSESDLMNYFGVSRITVRAALSELVEDGLLTRVQGKGTFVAPQKTTYPAMDLPGFNRCCTLAGKRPSTKLLEMGWCYPSEKQAQFWGISSQEKIIYSKRLRYMDGVPTMIEINHYPPQLSFLLNEDLNGSLFEIFNRYSYQYKVSERTLEICLATPEEAKQLLVKSNTPLLLFRDTHYDIDENPSFFSKQIYNSESTKFYL